MVDNNKQFSNNNNLETTIEEPYGGASRKKKEMLLGTKCCSIQCLQSLTREEYLTSIKDEDFVFSTKGFSAASRKCRTMLSGESLSKHLKKNSPSGIIFWTEVSESKTLKYKPIGQITLLHQKELKWNTEQMKNTAFEFEVPEGVTILSLPQDVLHPEIQTNHKERQCDPNDKGIKIPCCW